MSTFETVEKRCAICGEICRTTKVTSTSMFGSRDLDTRPPETQRSTMSVWVDECPQCGYVNDRIDVRLPIQEEYLQSAKYLSCDGIDFKNRIAIRFFRYYLLLLSVNKLHDAYYQLLHAAWACDDVGDLENGKKCRLMMVDLYEMLPLNIKNSDAEQALLSDVLRRAGLFQEVIERYRNFKSDNKVINDVVFLEVRLARSKDDNVYKIDDCYNKEIFEKINNRISENGREITKKFCGKCGEKLEIGKLYCNKCGTSIKTTGKVFDDKIGADVSKQADNSRYTSVKSMGRKYCGVCGSLIDNETKKCNGCGKQYFKGIKVNKGFAIALILIFLILLNKNYILGKFFYSASITQDEVHVDLDDIYTLDYDVNPENIKAKIGWRTSDASIVNVLSGGTIFPKNEGSAKIDILIDGIVKDSCVVNVSLNPVSVQNGEMIVSPEGTGSPEVTVNAPTNTNCYVYLKNIENEMNDVAFYVKAGASATVNVPAGKYDLYYATGQTWYGKKYKFGLNTSFYKSDEQAVLSESYTQYDVIEYTLYAVPNGNMRTENIDETEFPN